MSQTPLSAKLKRAVGAWAVRLSMFDPHRRINGLRADSLRVTKGTPATTAAAPDDDLDLQVAVEDTLLRVTGFSTPHTYLGWACSLFLLITFSVLSFSRFFANSPSLNELSVESRGAGLPVPDIALTVAAPNMAESELLRFFWPEFLWVDIRNGFSNRSDIVTVLNDKVRFGKDCPLVAGYDKKTDGRDGGPAVWPVFCLIDSRRVLEGRFGDPLWSFLSLSLHRCGCREPYCMGLPPVLNATWNKTKHTCASSTEVNATFTNVPLNVWFRFQREDWAHSGTLLPPKGMGQPGDWTWQVFETVPLEESSARDAVGVIELRHNTANVNNKWTLFGFGGDNTATASWFDWGDYISTPSGTSSKDFLTRPIFSVALRIAAMRRHVDVRFMTLQEAFAEASGSWFVAVVWGTIVALSSEKLVRMLQRHGGPWMSRSGVAGVTPTPARVWLHNRHEANGGGEEEEESGRQARQQEEQHHEKHDRRQTSKGQPEEQNSKDDSRGSSPDDAATSVTVMTSEGKQDKEAVQGDNRIARIKKKYSYLVTPNKD